MTLTLSLNLILNLILIRLRLPRSAVDSGVLARPPTLAHALVCLALAACGDDTAAATESTSPTGAGETAATTGASTSTEASTGDPGSTTAGPSTGPDTGGSTAGDPGTGTDATTTGDTDAPTTGDTGATTGVDVPCGYPITWPAEQGAEDSFSGALAALSPGASYVWRPDHGTFWTITNFEVVFPCEDTTPLWEAVFAFFESEPAIFGVDGGEWILEPPETQCQHVGDAPKTFNTSRKQLGDWAVFRDTFAVRLYRDAMGEVVLQSVVATYLPIMPDEIRAQIQACLDQGPAMAALEDAVRVEPFPYLSYIEAMQICQPSQMGTYFADDADAVNFTGDAQVDWYGAGDGSVTVTVDQRLELVLAPENVTPELESSNAACPEENGPDTIVGFFAYLDLITAEVVSKGAGLGCIVC